jgi:5-methylcytosine-specific restriction endonuclease McrA
MALVNWKIVFNKNNGYCAYCEVDLLASISTFWSAQRDHVKPKASGGNDDESNMVISCPTCNQALSRQKNLHTTQERKEFIQRLNLERSEIYNDWVRDLRNKA